MASFGSKAFKLADNGYDDRLANIRGTDASQKHENLLTTSPQYWKFSLDGMAKYDLPAIIDYVLMKTNNTFVHYVRHSQGTTLVMATTLVYNKKLKTLQLSNVKTKIHFLYGAADLITSYRVGYLFIKQLLMLNLLISFFFCFVLRMSNY